PSLLHRRRDVRDLAADDLLADRLDLPGDVLRRLRRELADADAVVLEAVHRVAATLELPLRRVLDRVVHRGVDALQRLGPDMGAEVGLVGVDPDPPDALLLRRIERAKPAAARDLEDDDRPALDLVERDLLALRLNREVLGVAVDELDAGNGRLG